MSTERMTDARALAESWRRIAAGDRKDGDEFTANRVEDCADALDEIAARLRGGAPEGQAVRDALDWLRSAIECITFEWDDDQKSLAKASLAAALSSTDAPVGVEGLPQPFGYVEPRHDLSGYEVFDEPSPRRAAIWNMHGMRKALAQTRAHYSIDADPDGIRERVADTITGALSFGAQGAHKPPAGHWLEPFWDMARAEREATVPPTVDEATARRLDDYLEGEFDIRIGKQAAHAALVQALAQDRASQAGAAGGALSADWRPIESAPDDVRIICAWLGAPGCSEVDVACRFTDHNEGAPYWCSPTDRLERYGVPDLWQPFPTISDDALTAMRAAAPPPAAEREVQ